MQRATGMFTGILLGAVAAGLGVGIFLHKANQDRIRLADQARLTLTEALRSREESRRAIEDANSRLELAKTQAKQAQETIRTLEEERAFLTQAIPLLPPSPRDIYGWSELVALQQGFTVKIPPRLQTAVNSQYEFSLAADSPSSRDPLLFILPYDEKREHDLTSELTTSTKISYLVHDHLLTGVRGTATDGRSPVYILRIQKNGKTTHLLWTEPPAVTRLGEKALLTVLSTLRFQ